MQINSLKERASLPKNIDKANTSFVQLIEELNKKSLTETFCAEVNQIIASINDLPDTDKSLLQELRKGRRNILSKATKDLKYIPKNYYMTLGMSIGMAAFGIPLGSAFGLALDNMGLMGIGLPIGMSLGLSIGIMLDKKAKDEGRQLEVASM